MPATNPVSAGDALVLEGVTRTFGALKAIEDVSLSVTAGERRALIGANGAGKTTLFNTVTGDFPPTSGTIRFFGRYKDLLKVGGENVDPIEVEGFLLRHPAIDQVQIIGVPDARLSEVPCACIIPKPGAEITQETLVAFCRGQLASFKIPQYTVILDDFPMTSSGKVQKCKLRDIAVVQVGAAEAGTTAVDARPS